MSEQQWYMTRRGHQIGPVPQSEIEAMMRSGSADGDTYVFTAGMTEWMRLKEVGAFQPLLAADGPGPIPTPPGRTAHEIDFRIEGAEMQFVEVELDPGESAIAEAGCRRPPGGGAARDPCWTTWASAIWSTDNDPVVV